MTQGNNEFVDCLEIGARSYVALVQRKDFVRFGDVVASSDIRERISRESESVARTNYRKIKGTRFRS